eukprot:COSAG03_NODE_642_length_6535_cov_21.663611_2_plen_101_part_00
MGTNSPRIAFATPSVVTRLIGKFIRKNFSIILTLSISALSCAACAPRQAGPRLRPVQLELHGGAPRHLRVHIYIVMIPCDNKPSATNSTTQVLASAANYL